MCPCQTQPCHREAGILVDGGLEEAGSLAERLSASGIQSLLPPQIKVVCLRIQTPWLVVYHAGMYIIVENRSVRCCCLYRLDVAIRCAQTTACLACLTNHAIGTDFILHSFDVPGGGAVHFEFLRNSGQRSIDVERISIPLRRRKLLRADVLTARHGRSALGNGREQSLQCGPYVGI